MLGSWVIINVVQMEMERDDDDRYHRSGKI